MEAGVAYRKTPEGTWSEIAAPWPRRYAAMAATPADPGPAPGELLVLGPTGDGEETSPVLLVHAAVFDAAPDRPSGLELAEHGLATAPPGCACFWLPARALLVALPVFPWCRGVYRDAHGGAPVELAVPAVRAASPFVPGQPLRLAGVPDTAVVAAVAPACLAFEDASHLQPPASVLVELPQPRGGCLVITLAHTPAGGGALSVLAGPLNAGTGWRLAP